MSDQRYIVESNCRAFMLACSKANRADKFKRVSQDTLDYAHTAVDNIIRQIESKVPEPLHPSPLGFGTDEVNFITGYAMEKCKGRLEMAIRKILRNKVQSTPSCGITL